MRTVIECPLNGCDWKLENDDDLDARNIAMSPQVAAALGTPLDAFLSIRSHQVMQSRERELEQHFATHSTLEWVQALMAARAKVAELEASR
jgi:hypothetical protein